MKRPAELNDDDMREIATNVLKRLEARFPKNTVKDKTRKVGFEFINTLFRATYLAVREQIEKEDQ